MPEAITKSDLEFLEESAASGSKDDVLAARELAGNGSSVVEVKDESTGEVQRIPVTKIGKLPVGQNVKIDLPNSATDNWRVNNH